MMEETETFWSLFKSLPHWEFEIFLMVVFDGVIGALIWPFLKRHWNHHVERDIREGKHPKFQQVGKFCTACGKALEISETPQSASKE